jgi:hypothetical protein
MNPKKPKKKKLSARAVEIRKLILAIAERGVDANSIAATIRASVRSVYRWRDEGVVPPEFRFIQVREILNGKAPRG